MKIRQILETEAPDAFEDRLRQQLVAAGPAATQVFDQNIAMFSRYKPSPHVTATLDQLTADRQALIDFINGAGPYSAISYNGRELLSGIPDWGTKGT